jgi:(E)-4-hydroxy-3-methyl-but-2-enyl pyrophosphate reductase
MGNVHEVRIAKRTGFCYGVREAIDKAKEAAAAGKVTHTLGQVVHNEGVIAALQAQGIETVETLDQVGEGAAVVIRAHGVRPDVLARAESRGLDVIDGTCTWVIQEQREITKLVDEGYSIVLLGTPRHPEVVGLLGFAPDAIVVDEEEDWETIPRRKKMALLSQSTQPPWKFEKLAAFMVGRCHELQIESEDDLIDPAVFGNARVVGVTGGTSTPIEDLRCVAERILRLAGTAEAAAKAIELATTALAAAATPAGRTTSLPGPQVVFAH